MKRSTLFTTVAMLALSTALAAAQSTTTRPNTQDRKVEETSPPSPSPQQNPQTQRSQGNNANQPSTSGAGAQNQQQPSAPQSTQNQQNQPAPAQRSTQGQQPQPSTSQTQNQPAQGNQQQGAQQQGAQQPNAPQPSNQAAQPSAQQPGQQPSGQAAATTPQQRTQIATAIQQQNVSPVRVNFALNVGVAVPSSVRLAPLPDTIVSIVPQYRGYNYFVTEQQIVIVEPASHQIVEVLPMEGRSRASAAPAQTPRFSKEQRESIKKHATSRQRTTTTGSSRRVTVEETIPADVELEEFSDAVVQEVPTVRSYRYIRRDNDVIVVDPGSRRVLDVID